MARFKKLSLDEARESFTLLSEAERQTIKGGCSNCTEALRYGYTVYTEYEYQEMAEAGTWRGGYVCGRGNVLPEVLCEGDAPGTGGVNYGSYCPDHRFYFPINGSCYGCSTDSGGGSSGGQYGETDYGSTGYGPNPGGYGGSGGGSGSSDGGTSQWKAKEIMDTTKFVRYYEGSNCLELCKGIMDNYEINSYGDSQHVYQLLGKKDGVYINKTIDPVSNYKKAVDCINRHLDAGRPIIVGVAYDKKSDINEGVTDHFVVITGRGYEAGEGNYFTYMDPGFSDSNKGCSTASNRLYYKETSSPLLIDEVAGSGDQKFRVSQVRPNDGQKLNETVVSNNNL